MSENKEHILENGRIYRVCDTGDRYNSLTLSGGLLVEAWQPKYKNWTKAGNFNDVASVKRFLDVANTFSPMDEVPTPRTKTNRWNPSYKTIPAV